MRGRRYEHSISDGAWHYIVGTWTKPAGQPVEQNDFTLCVDGRPVTTVGFDEYSGGGVTANSPLTGYKRTGIGWHYSWGPVASSWGRFAGTLDEIRLSPRVQSTNWIWASYMTVASNAAFASHGNVEKRRPISGGLILAR